MSTAEELKRVIAETKKRSPKRFQKLQPKPFPSNVTIDEIIKSLPSEVFTKSRFKSFGSLFVTICMLSFSMYLLTVLPWYLWPVGWFLGGASVTGLFTIAYDCVNSSFANSKIVNYIVGTVAMLPLGYSFESWKTHLKYDLSRNAKQTARGDSSQLTNYIWKWAQGKTFWLASVGYWAEEHLNINVFNPEDRLRVRISFVGLYVFAAVFFSTMWYFVGLFGIVKYWLLPWLGYHFLVSTTTLLPTVVLEEKNKSFVVHCDYPKWLEFLCNDISLAIPRNISTAIPHYHLRKAYKALKQQWGEYFLEINFEWALLSDLMKTAPLQSFKPLFPVPVVPLANKLATEDSNTTTSSSSAFAWVSDLKRFLARINWMHAVILSSGPILGIYGLLNYPLTLPTIVWSCVYYYLTGLGITAGYHRLFAHRAYSAHPALKFVLLMLGAGAVQGSARWWCRDHRAHHRYTDTDKDPYSAQNGFWYSHIGWLLVKQDPSKIGRAAIDDLNQDQWIRWQHRNYIPIALFMGVIFPTLVAGVLWGDWAGGYFFAGLLRMTFVQQSTFMVNSLAHYLGHASYADNHTPRDSFLTALVTLGEGYHNFHHEFPSDYRNAIKFYQYDPTKWTIKLLSYLGITYNLKKFPENEVQKGQIQMRQKIVDKLKTKVDWGRTNDQLPVVSKKVMEEVGKEGYKLVVINGVIHDVTDFIDDHPGGRAYLESAVGKDGTRQFTGGVYEHSNGAHNLLSQMRVGRTDEREWMEVEVEAEAQVVKGETKAADGLEAKKTV